MIFDNAGEFSLVYLRPITRQYLPTHIVDKNAEVILRSYWPIGSNGSILITSRDYYNFTKDLRRRGQTVKAFTDDESWDLLLQLLGKEWRDKFNDGLVKETDTVAARAWIRELKGLGL